MMKNLDVEEIRADFPILERRMHGRPLIYLDSAATAQKPRQVLEALDGHYRNVNANVHRGAYQLSSEATDAYEEARRKVAAFLGAPEDRSLVFVRNATEGINLLARTWADRELAEGDEIIVSVAEHHANLVPWQLAAERTGARLVAVPLTEEGRFDLDAYRDLLGPRTKLVAVTHMSNVLGTVNPLADITALAHEHGAVVFADGAQAAPHLPVDVAELGVDAYAVSGHKLLGPTGIGALWVRADLLETLPPFLGGGEMIRTVTIEAATFADIPMRFEAGTPAIAEAAAFGAAADYLGRLGMDAVWRHGRHLAEYALDALAGVPGLTVYGPRGSDRGAIVPFNLNGVHPHDVASALDAEGIAVRAGHHCAQPLMKALDVQSTVRASAGVTTTEAELDALADALTSAAEFFGSFT